MNGQQGMEEIRVCRRIIAPYQEKKDQEYKKSTTGRMRLEVVQKT